MPVTNLLALLFLSAAPADDPCKSGPAPGERYGPYSFLIATGPKRGTAHCYVCETGDKPAVLVFARQPDGPLGKLLVQLDQALTAHHAAGLGGWVTFLSDDQPALEPKLVDWSRQLGLKALPLGVFEDADGPPRYRLSRDAAVTVLLVKGGKVTANHAFRAGELTDERAKAVLGGVSALVK
jgi:hypothetical protein